MKMKRILIVCVWFAAVAVFAANEINNQSVFTVNKGNLSIQRAVNLNFDLTNSAPNVASGTQVMTTNPVAIIVGNVATNGWSFWRNLSTNTYTAGGTNIIMNAIELGYYDLTNFQPIVRMNGGEPAFFRCAQGVTLYGRSTTNTLILEKNILDD